MYSHISSLFRATNFSNDASSLCETGEMGGREGGREGMNEGRVRRRKGRREGRLMGDSGVDTEISW